MAFARKCCFLTAGIAALIYCLPVAGPGVPVFPSVAAQELTLAGESGPDSSVVGRTTTEKKDFPRLDSRPVNRSRFANSLPTDRDASAVPFAVAKLLLIVAAVWLWLRCLKVCAGAADADAPEEVTDSWEGKIFTIGLMGVLGALVLPAYVPGLCLLFGAAVLPFAGYKRWRNSRTPEPSVPVRWKHLIRAPPVVISGVRAGAVELLSGKIIGTANSTISLIPRSGINSATTSESARRDRTSPGFRAVLALIDDAVANRATDLHINTKDNEVIIRQRIDGALSSVGTLPTELGASVINVFKVMSDLNIADRRRSQDGSFRVDVNGRRLCLRVSSQGTQAGEKLSIRLLDPAKSFSDFASLGMSVNTQEKFTSALGRSNGLILVVGATGAGKSTTACAALQTIQGDDRNIVSIEDPIEYQIPAIDQIEVNYRAGQSFETALRSVLRQDSDVIFIGEIRDQETAKIACQAAMSGQLVLATMHANDAASGAMRLVELGVDLHSAASALRAVLAQRLVRRLCLACRMPMTPAAEAKEYPELQGFEGVLYRSPDVSENHCAECDGRGFTRRTGVFELLEVTSTIRDLIREKADPSTLTSAAQDNGMRPLTDEGWRLVREGVISSNEFNRVFDTP